LNRNHDYVSGYIQFINREMADRAYTLFNGTTFRNGTARLQLKINSPSTNREPEAHAAILHIKNLPNHINNNKSLYELFRTFGPMILCKIMVEQQQGFKGTALIQYFDSQNQKDVELSMVSGRVRVKESFIYII
jgi:polyadenylate-binding protein